MTLTAFPNSAAGWTQGATVSGGFGTFNAGASALPDGQNPDLVNPGETGTFVFSFTCVGGTCDETDLIVPTSKGITFAAKFINGGGLDGDSAWGSGTAAPEPGSATLILLGLIGLRGIRRSWRA